MLRALAAAVIARMDSLPVTLGAAMALGMAEQAVLFKTGRTIIVDACCSSSSSRALLFQRRRSASRAEDAGDVVVGSDPRGPADPARARRVPEVFWTKIAGGRPDRRLPAVRAARDQRRARSISSVSGSMFTMVILSLVVLTGWAGQISLGQLAFVAFGAAVGGSLAQQGKDFFVTLLVAWLVGAVVAVAIGIPALRIRGLFLSVTTLAFALTTGTYFLNEEFFPWLTSGYRRSDHPSRDLRQVRPRVGAHVLLLLAPRDGAHHRRGLVDAAQPHGTIAHRDPGQHARRAVLRHQPHPRRARRRSRSRDSSLRSPVRRSSTTSTGCRTRSSKHRTTSASSRSR